MAVIPPATNLGSPTPSGGTMKLQPINRGTPTPIKKPLPSGGTMKLLPYRGTKTPPISADSAARTKTAALRYNALKNKTLQQAAAKRIALGGAKKYAALKTKKMTKDWATAVKNNPKGINFAALRANDKTWKGSK